MPLITTSLKHAILDLKRGKPVAIPTETVYGLAAMINNEEAIRAVFDMKKRPINHPLIVHVAKDWDLNQVVEDIPEYAQLLINYFWPGPLTLVLRCKKDRLSSLINGGQSTVAIRCPAHPLAQKLLNKLKIPLVAPSANPFGKISPTTALHVKHSFSEKELTILDGGRCNLGIESTIIDASDPLCYQILRHGLIDEAALSAVIQTKCITKESSIRVPGKLESHYQPQKPLYYFHNYASLSSFCQEQTEEIYVIASNKPSRVAEHHFKSFVKQPEQFAFELYFQLREADESNATCIAIELPPSGSKWEGIRERILKAGHPYSIS